MSDPICQTCGRSLLCNEFRWCTRCRKDRGKRSVKKRTEHSAPAEPVEETPFYFVAPATKKRQPKAVFHCDHCDRYTSTPLGDDGRCSICQTREPDPTLEEIWSMAAKIRSERPESFLNDEITE